LSGGLQVVRLVVDKGGRVCGVEYNQNKTTVSQRAGSVVLASGGFGANKEFLKRYAPQYSLLGTTNANCAMGDGLTLASSVGGYLVDVDQVQVHPTGFIDPKNPKNSVKVRKLYLNYSLFMCETKKSD